MRVSLEVLEYKKKLTEILYGRTFSYPKESKDYDQLIGRLMAVNYILGGKDNLLDEKVNTEASTTREAEKSPEAETNRQTTIREGDKETPDQEEFKHESQQDWH